MIDKRTVDAVIEASNAQIVDIVSDFVTLRRRGANYIGRCPFHDEKTGSFTVSPAKGIFKCFGCGKAGNALHFVMEHEHVTFVEGIKYLGQKVGIRVEEQEMTPEMKQAQTERESLMEVTEFAKKQFIENLWNGDEGQLIGLPYFRERGFRDDIIRKFELGYSSEQRDWLTNIALKKGYKLEYLQRTGLTIVGDRDYKADRFFGRVMFPIHSISGRVIAFGGRVRIKNDKTAKYLNSPESELYHKSDIVYGIFQAKNAIIKNDACYLVEGYTDVISMHQAGIENVVASSGTSLTTNQIKLIQRFTNNITVLYDGDSAGIHASLRGIDMILAEGMNVEVLLLPDGEDPDSFARSHSADEYVNFINEHKTDFISFKTALLKKDSQNDPLKRSNLINEVVLSISKIQDIALRSVYVQRCSKELDIDESTLFNILQNLLVRNTQRAIDERNKQQRFQQAAEMRKRAEESMGLNEQQMKTEPPAAMPVSYAEVTALRDNPYFYEERMVGTLFLRHIDKPLFKDKPEKTTVARFVTQRLNDDSEMYQIVDPTIAKVLNVYNSAEDKESVSIATYINSPEPDIAAFAIDATEERYKLSTIHERFAHVQAEEEQLDDLVPLAVNSLQFKHVVAILDSLLQTINDADKNGLSKEEQERLLEQFAALTDVKRQLAPLVGGRSVLFGKI